MPTPKSVKCRICGKEFTPAWNHPEQTVCYDESCRRKMAAERSARYAKKRKSTQSGRLQYAERERNRYQRSKAGIHVTPQRNPRPSQRLTLKSLYGEFIQLRSAFTGLLKLLKDRFGREITVEECQNAAGDNIPNKTE